MTDLITLYRAQFKTTIASQFQYRGALAIWIIGLILQPVIYLSVWSTVARSQGGNVDGFTASDFAAYYLTALVVSQATFTWIMWEMEYWIRQGTSPRSSCGRSIQSISTSPTISPSSF